MPAEHARNLLTMYRERQGILTDRNGDPEPRTYLLGEVHIVEDA